MFEEEQLTQLYQEQLSQFELAGRNYSGLQDVQYRDISFGEFFIRLQYNPARMISTNAKMDAATLQNRKCFLCQANMPEAQKGISYGDEYNIFINPYPIFSPHFTVPTNAHVPQLIAGRFMDLLNLTFDLPKYTIFYNGPGCGASAPDHFHFQIAPRHIMPLENDVQNPHLTEVIIREDFYSVSVMKNYLREMILLQSSDQKILARLFDTVFGIIGETVVPYQEEPQINLLCWFDNCQWTVCIFPRRERRPWQFFAEEEKKVLFSPGCVDMAGLLITPREEDFKKYSQELLTDLFGQVSATSDQYSCIVEQLRKMKR